MGKYIKYYKMLLQWKDVSKVYKEENNGAEKPAYLSRRFLGVFFAFVGLAVSTLTNYVIPPELLNALTDNIGSLKDVVQIAFPAILSIYGTLTAIVGIFTKKG